MYRVEAADAERPISFLPVRPVVQARTEAPAVAMRAIAIELTLAEWQLILDGIIVRDCVVLARHGREA